MKSNGKRILSITLKRMVDESPDTSYLGEYSDKSRSDYSIDREHSTDCQLNTHTNDARMDNIERIIYYLDEDRVVEGENPESQWWEGLDEAIDFLAEIQKELGECDCGGHGDWGRNESQYFNPNWENYKGEPDADIRKYCVQDYERMERLNAGDWCFIGIRADAVVQLSSGGVTQDITSGGLWGIESDSSDDYLRGVEDEELGELRAELKVIGFSARAIAIAVNNLTRKDG